MIQLDPAVLAQFDSATFLIMAHSSNGSLSDSPITGLIALTFNQVNAGSIPVCPTHIADVNLLYSNL